MEKYTFIVNTEFINQRLDKYLLFKLQNKSRQYLQKLIKTKKILINNQYVDKPGYKLKSKDQIDVCIPEPIEIIIPPNNIPLDIIYEDKNLLIINKEAGIVVHPSSSSTDNNTIVNAVIYHCKNELSGIAGVLRPGIVHRLDKDTSGILVIAKNDITHRYLSNLFIKKEIKKEYIALTKDIIRNKEGIIQSPIGRSIKNRKKMSVITSKQNKIAITKFKIIKTFSKYTLLKINLITGRTHQIRVHLSSISHPVCGDKLYGDSKTNKYFRDVFGLNRQFLHAKKISFVLPNKTKESVFEAKLPDTLRNIINNLE